MSVFGSYASDERLLKSIEKVADAAVVLSRALSIAALAFAKNKTTAFTDDIHETVKLAREKLK